MEPVPGQDAPQVGMASERDPEHVEGLALRPVRREEDLGDRGDLFPVRDAALDPDPVVLRKRVEVVDDVETRLPVPPVHRGDVHAVAKVLRVLQVSRDVGDLLAAHDHRDLLRELLGRNDRVGQRGPHGLDPRVRARVRGLDLLRRRRLVRGGRRFRGQHGGGLRLRCRRSGGLRFRRRRGGGVRSWRGVRRRGGLVGHRGS